VRPPPRSGGRRKTSTRALESGWTDSELAEAFARIAVNLFTNYLNHMVGTELDIPPAAGLEVDLTA